MKYLLITAGIICIFTFMLDARTIHVPSEQPTIQAGIDASVDGDTVLVADGIYTGTGNKNLDYSGKAIVVVSENGADVTIINCEDDGRGFCFNSGEDSLSVLNGFTINNGNVADGGGGIASLNFSSPTIANCTISNSTASSGGGIYCNRSSPDISECTIEGNTAETHGGGGGIYCDYYSDPTIKNCIISRNSANVYCGGGGGIYCDYYSDPSIINCIISRNSATAYGGDGGGIYCSGSATITNCTISENTANDEGGGICCYYYSSLTITNCTISENTATNGGGGIFCHSSNPTIKNCIISKNSANAYGGDGGGIYCVWDSAPTITNCTISENTATNGGGGIFCHCSCPSIINCIISKNSANAYGGDSGGIYCIKSSPSITNCTISGNPTLFAGGGIFCYSSVPTIKNCILWDDSPDEIYIVSGTPIVTYSDIEGGWEGEGNINSDPLFVDPENNNYHIQYLSPCIDRGTDENAPEHDFEGDERWDHPDMPNDPSVVDMGADENNGSNVIRVPDDYPTIQAGIDAAAGGDIVLVADGTYTGEGNRDIDFSGKDITVLSECGPEVTVIDCEANSNEMHRGFIFRSGETERSKLKGFTIINGYFIKGSGIHFSYSSPAIDNCVISGNVALAHGGGIYCIGSHPTLTNCTISGNTTILGGGLFCCYSSGPLLMNCTFSGNTADYNGGAIHSDSSAPTITNCVLWGDTPDEIFAWGPGILKVTYSNIQGGWSGEGNIDADPLFLDPEGSDFHLSCGSPCIDSGTSEGAPGHDIDGDPRPLGVGFDMGSDEYNGGLLVFLDNYPELIEPGETCTFTASVRNDGYEEASFDHAEIDITGPASITKILYSGVPITLAPDQSVSTEVSQYVPMNAPEGIYTVTITVYFEENEIAGDSFDIEVGVNWRQYGFDAQKTGYNSDYHGKIKTLIVGDDSI